MKLKLVGRLASGDPLSIPSAGRTRNEAASCVFSLSCLPNLSIPSAGRTRNEAHTYPTQMVVPKLFQYPLRVVPGMKLLLKFTDGDILPVLSIPSAGRTRNEAMVLSVILPLPSAFNTLCGSYQE